MGLSIVLSRGQTSCALLPRQNWGLRLEMMIKPASDPHATHSTGRQRRDGSPEG